MKRPNAKSRPCDEAAPGGRGARARSGAELYEAFGVQSADDQRRTLTPQPLLHLVAAALEG